MVIVIDTREQRPFDFTGYPDVTVQRREVWPGDYTVLGGAGYCAIERKSVNDLVQTMKLGYAGFGATTPKRFDRELKALLGIKALGGIARIVVEPDGFIANAYNQIESHGYRSTIEPSKIFGFITAIREGWGIPVDLCESRAHATHLVHLYCQSALGIKRANMARAKAIAAAISEMERNEIQ